MEDENKLKRDSKGDLEFDYGKFDWDLVRKANYTYVFHYFNADTNHHFPYFNLFSSNDERLEEAKKDPEFYSKRLYHIPDNPPNERDSAIKYHNWQLSLLVNFFKEVFEEEAFIHGGIPSNKVFEVILPRSIHDKIIAFIKEFELGKIEDLLFEVISTAQKKYIKEIFFWERPEMQKIVNTASKESQKVIRVIEKVEMEERMEYESNSIPPSRLLHINFIFNDGPIKIEHPWLAKEFVDYFKDNYNDLLYKDWRIDLTRYPDRFEENKKKRQFRYQLAISFYNLLTKGDFFKVEKELTPNKLMLCIVKLLEFCLIPVGDPDDLEEQKIKIIRPWFKRHELKPAITNLEIHVDREKLIKYFSPKFVNFTSDIKKLDALVIASYLGKRFNIEHLLADLAHIAQTLKETNWLIGHQILGENNAFQPQFEEFSSFSKLVNGIKKKQKIALIKFKFDGDDKEYELTQRLPLYLIEEAINDYSDDNKVEFDTDAVKANLTKTENGNIKVEKEDQFNQPEDRFMVSFVKSFYNYLLVEAPPINDKDFRPSERYYSIIANMLQKTWSFYHQRHPEWFVVAKVKQWHTLNSSI